MQGGGRVQMGADAQVMPPQAKGHLGLPETTAGGRGKGGSCPTDVRGSTALPTPRFQASGFQNWCSSRSVYSTLWQQPQDPHTTKQALGSAAALPPTISPHLLSLSRFTFLQVPTFRPCLWWVLVCSLHQHSHPQLSRALPSQGLWPSTCSLQLRSLRDSGQMWGSGGGLAPPNTLAATQKECGKHLENAFLGGYAVAHPTLRCGLAPWRLAQGKWGMAPQLKPKLKDRVTSGREKVRSENTKVPRV